MSSQAPKKRFVSTGFGRIAYLESGPSGAQESGPSADSGAPAALFVHGIPTSGHLWRHVLRFLGGSYRCLAPDLMGLGDTEVDPDSGRFDMEAQAEMLLDFMSALGHERFALVCHDQGGAAAQILATRAPERLSCFVITDCVCYDNWPVPAIRRLQRLGRVPGLLGALGRTGIFSLVETRTAFSSFRRGVYRKDRLEDATIREYLRPMRESDAGRRRFLRFLMAGSDRSTRLVAPALSRLGVPTLVLWAADDRYLSPSWGLRLFEEIPGARAFRLIPFCGHFWQEERPAEFASHIRAFLEEHARVRPALQAGAAGAPEKAEKAEKAKKAKKAEKAAAKPARKRPRRKPAARPLASPPPRS